MIRKLSRLFGSRRAKPGPLTNRLTSEQAKSLARNTDPEIRASVAYDAAATPEILYYLVRDAASLVRRAVAGNPNTPRQADLILAVDPDSETRRRVAEKISGQLGKLSKESAQLWALTIQVLDALARDNMTQVRKLIAEGAKAIEQVPSELMTSLGRDREAEVAVPALHYVGQIKDADLVEIVESSPDPRVIGAVAKRPAIGPHVAEAVIQHGDEEAITILLGNRNAAIAPDALGRVVDRAQSIEAWHAPLVNRPGLTDEAAMRLASFVTQQLLQVLQRRPDLDPETNTAIQVVVKQRGVPIETVIPEVVDTEGPMSRARRHHAQGTLSEDLVIDSLGTDQPFVVAALALRSQLPLAVVEKILSSSSAKSLTALAWKSDYSMRLAFQMQLRLARLPPKARLNPTSTGFPLAPEAMEWQIEFFKTLVA
jgi:uncharacterized protein (DUF2336 family)